jgi:cell division protein FtsW (lipid II flippase)
LIHSFGRPWLYLLAPQFALVTGVLLMRRHGVPSALWMLNLGAGALLTLLCAALLVAKPRTWPRGWWAAVAGAAVLLLAATFVDSGIDGVHRWVRAGPLYVHAGAIALPALIVALHELRSSSNSNASDWSTSLLSAAVMLLLTLQPDAAQASAFGIAVLVMIVRGRHSMTTTVTGIIVMACVVAVWKRPDTLAPVPHVEGIVGLAAQSGPVWLTAALVSLILLLMPFVIAHSGNTRAAAGAMAPGVYFVVLCVMPALGAFPVPLLGFGLAPILGYFIGLAWLLTRDVR